MSSIAKTLVGIDHREGDLGADLGDGQDRVLARDVGRDDLDHRFVDLDPREVDRRHAEVLGEELDELLFGQGADLDQRRADAPALLLLQGEPVAQLVRVDLSGLEKGVAQAIAAHVVTDLSPPEAAFDGCRRQCNSR